MQSQIPRSTFPHGDDCAVVFVGRADNNKAYIDEWQITVDTDTYYFRMMRMKTSAGPWVFGSFDDTHKQVWQFRSDARKQAGFRGGSFTFVHEGVTYAMFANAAGIQHVLPFVEFLRQPATVAEVTGGLRQAIIAAYQGVDRPPAQPAIDPRRLAALRAVQAQVRSEVGELEPVAWQAVTSSRPAKTLQTEDEAAHEWFFTNVLAHMHR